MRQFVGASTGVDQATLPSGWQPGDFAVVFAFRTGSTTPPSVPSGWQKHSESNYTYSSQSVAAITGYRKLQSGDSDTSVWTNATHLVCCVYREFYAMYGDAWSGIGDTYISFAYYSKILPKSWFYSAAGTTYVDYPFPTEFESWPITFVRRAMLSNSNGTVAVYDCNGSGQSVGETWGATFYNLPTVPIALTLVAELDTGERIVGGEGGDRLSFGSIVNGNEGGHYSLFPVSVVGGEGGKYEYAVTLLVGSEAGQIEVVDELLLGKIGGEGGTGNFLTENSELLIANVGAVLSSELRSLLLSGEGGMNIEEVYQRLVNLNLGGIRLERDVSLIGFVPNRVAIIIHKVRKE